MSDAKPIVMHVPLNGWGNLVVAIGAACALRMLVSWYWRELSRLYIRRRWIRRWRMRMLAQAPLPFHPQRLSRTERTCLIGRGGVNSEQWFWSVAGEYVRGLREMPTCAEYLAEFGRRPRIRPVRRARLGAA